MDLQENLILINFLPTTFDIDMLKLKKLNQTRQGDGNDLQQPTRVKIKNDKFFFRASLF